MQTLNNVPTEIEWRVYRGDYSKLTIQLKDDQGNAVPNADGILCVARRYPTDPEILTMMSAYFGSTPPQQGQGQGDSSTGIVTVEIPWQSLISQVQDPFAWGKQFYFDVQLYFQGAQVTILKVKVDIESDVSRAQGVPNFV